MVVENINTSDASTMLAGDVNATSKLSGAR